MKHRHFFFLSLILFSFFSILFHTNIPVIWPDEVLFFNPSWELSHNGIMRTSVLDGLIPGMDTHTLWMPPLRFHIHQKDQEVLQHQKPFLRAE